jgi:hypothetical protein
VVGTSDVARTGGGAAASTLAGGRRRHDTIHGPGQSPEHERRFRERVRRPRGLGPRRADGSLLESAAEASATAPVVLRGLERPAATDPTLVAAAGGRGRPDGTNVVRAMAGVRP